MTCKLRRKEKKTCAQNSTMNASLLTSPTESCRVVLRPSLLHAVLGLFKFVKSTAFMSQKIKIRSLKKKKRERPFFFFNKSETLGSKSTK